MSVDYIPGMSCPSCGGKMTMYYCAICLDCTDKAEIKKNLMLSMYYIEHKYNVDLGDWWHLFIDSYEFVNDCKIVINWSCLYDMCKEDWQRDITQLFVNEFGDEEIEVEISW